MVADQPAMTPSKMHKAPSTSSEKILVTVRVRPLNSREQASYDLVAWDFPDEHTIVLKNPNQGRYSGPYAFDKVFDPTCTSQNVYEAGARNVALSALSGINATVFAYGQTSSGKTYTMRGIYDLAIKDIYHQIETCPERDFMIKFSAMEIYNETVIDLLNNEHGPLRLLDDPEKGIIVEKLSEEVIKDREHLRHLISFCEAQRQVGETALNDKSSRSHQILRLVVESILRDNSEEGKSLIASLNLVDLAGSERASQTNAKDTKLKEGSYINRSLLTLTTVIRKLSGGKNVHIPYRDSKLTRILQFSLGGNARTAIICTLSPALSQAEQSRKTLVFATNAKEVTNTAQVNMVVSDKRLVKQLQKEVARLEAELRSPDLSSSSRLKTLLVEKELKIQQMEMEVRELKRERDIAQTQLEQDRKARKERRGVNNLSPSRKAVRSLSFSNEEKFRTPSRFRPGKRVGRHAASASTDPSALVHEIRKLEFRQRQLGEEANRALEVLHKEVASHKLGNQDAVENIAKLLSEIKTIQAAAVSAGEEVATGDKANLKEEISRLDLQSISIASLEKKLDSVQKSIENLIVSFPSSEGKKVLPFALSNNANIICSPCSPYPEIENRPPERGSQRKSVNVRKVQRMFKNAAEENIRTIRSYVTEMKERVAKLQYQKQLLVCQVLELEANDGKNNCSCSSSGSEEAELVFEDQRKQVVMLWHLCHVSIVHRTQFYLLFKGDPDDRIYLEVEVRRLTWLEQHLAELGNASPALLGDDPARPVSSSIRALKQEREYLARRVGSRLSPEERERIYAKWEIPAVGRQRRMQLVNKLWSDPLDMQHVGDSAEIVAKLVGFCESGEQVSKEMFQLNFVSPNDKKPWMGWNLISNLLHF